MTWWVLLVAILLLLLWWGSTQYSLANCMSDAANPESPTHRLASEFGWQQEALFKLYLARRSMRNGNTALGTREVRAALSVGVEDFMAHGPASPSTPPREHEVAAETQSMLAMSYALDTWKEAKSIACASVPSVPTELNTPPASLHISAIRTATSATSNGAIPGEYEDGRDDSEKNDDGVDPREADKTFGSNERVSRAFRAAMAGPPFDDQFARDLSEMSGLERDELAFLIQEAGGLPANVRDAFGDEEEEAFLLAVREKVDKFGKTDLYHRAMSKAVDDKEFAITIYGFQMSGHENKKSPALVAALMLDGMNRYLIHREVGIGFLVSVANRFYEKKQSDESAP